LLILRFAVSCVFLDFINTGLSTLLCHSSRFSLNKIGNVEDNGHIVRTFYFHEPSNDLIKNSIAIITAAVLDTSIPVRGNFGSPKWGSAARSWCFASFELTNLWTFGSVIGVEFFSPQLKR